LATIFSVNGCIGNAGIETTRNGSIVYENLNVY